MAGMIINGIPLDEIKAKLRLETSEVEVDVFSWQGMSLGATHWYGKYKVDGYTFDDVSKIATKREIIEYNKKFQDSDDRMDKYLMLKEGSRMSGFQSREHVIQTAIEQCKELFPKVKKLIVDDVIVKEWTEWQVYQV